MINFDMFNKGGSLVYRISPLQHEHLTLICWILYIHTMTFQTKYQRPKCETYLRTVPMYFVDLLTMSLLID